MRSFFARSAEALAPVERSYDVVVIDCPPQLGFLNSLCTLRRNGRISYRSSPNARRYVDVPIPYHDVRPSKRGGKGRREHGI